MEGSPYAAVSGSSGLPGTLEMPVASHDVSEQMKALRKLRLSRQVLADPSMAAKLVAVQASPVYNARGDLIPAASAGFGLTA